MSDGITRWLEQLELGQYARLFLENDIDIEILPDLTEADLEKLGVSMGHRKRLLRAAKELAQVVPTPTGITEAPEAERRQLTVMFCDLVGSTALSERLDPEDYREVLSAYQEAARGAIESYAGYIARYMGDGLLVYFGYPQAHEDDAERAVRAGLSVVVAVRELEVQNDIDFEVRIGIATGLVVVGDIVGEGASEERVALGETPNLAARLQGIARPGSVIVADATQRLVAGRFSVDKLEPQFVKGLSEPIQAYQATGVLGTSRFEAATVSGLTSFVGRSNELNRLLECWRDANAGNGQVVLLEGEPGIGKSRLLQEFQRTIEGAVYIPTRFHCSPFGVNTAFSPIIEHLQQAADFGVEDSEERKLDKLEALLAEPISDISAGVPLIAALLRLPVERYPKREMTPEKQKLETIGILCGQLEGLSRRQPVLVLVEDMHWMDPSTLDVFDAVVTRLDRLPILCLMTHRPEFAPRWHEESHVTHLELHRLDRSDGAAVVEEVTGGKTVPKEILDQILERTDGVPLFVEELTKTVLEAGFLEEVDGRYEVTGSIPARAIPATLHDSLLARLDRLSSGKEVAQAAACIGREFSSELLSAVLGVEMAPLDAALKRLQDAELVFPRGTGERARYVFKHALVQDAAYESLLTRKRRELHARIAEVLEASAAPDPATLAHHCAAAGLAEKAATYYLEAGNRSLRATGYAEACAELEAGLREVEALPATSERDRLGLDLSMALGTARLAYFGWPHSSVPEILEPAFRLARKLRDTEALRTVLFGLWVHFMCRSEFPKALEWLDVLNSAVEEHEDTELSLIREMSGGVQRFWMAEYDKVSQHTEKIRMTYEVPKHSGVVRLTNHDPRCTSLTLFGANADWILGYPDRAIAHVEEGIKLARELEHPFNLAFTLTIGSWFMFYRRDLQRILSQCDEAEEIAKEHAVEFIKVNLVHQARGCALCLCDAKAGYELLTQQTDFWIGIGGAVNVPMGNMHRSIALSELGSMEKALDIIDRAISDCHAKGEQWIAPEALRTRGELLLVGEFDVQGAEAAFQEAIALAREHGAKSWELRAATSLARLRQSQGEIREGHQLLAPVYEWFSEGFDTPDLEEAKALLEELS